jgi:hypothetical protein
MNKSKKIIILVSSVISSTILLLGCVGFYFLPHTTQHNNIAASDRQVVLVNVKRLVGGGCSYYSYERTAADEYSRDGKICVDEGSYEKAARKIGKSLNDDSNYGHLLEVNADISVKKEKYIQTSNPPIEKDLDTIHFKKIHSVKIIDFNGDHL